MKAGQQYGTYTNIFVKKTVKTAAECFKSFANI